MRTRQADSLAPCGLVDWILVIRVFHSPPLLCRSFNANPFTFLFSTWRFCQCTRGYVSEAAVPPFPDPDARPFDLAPRAPGPKRRAVLLLHGFTGTPFEMRFLGEELAGR